MNLSFFCIIPPAGDETSYCCAGLHMQPNTYRHEGHRHACIEPLAGRHRITLEALRDNLAQQWHPGQTVRIHSCSLLGLVVTLDNKQVCGAWCLQVTVDQEMWNGNKISIQYEQ